MANRFAATLAGGACLVALSVPLAASAQQATHSYDIPAGPLRAALASYVRQSGRQLIYRGSEMRDAKSPGVRGKVSDQAALEALLAGSGYVARIDGSGAVAIVAAVAGQVGNVGEADNAGADEDERGKAEILVVGSKSQNVDIRRTEDDPLPYVVFGRKEIEDSGATNVEDFLRRRLPMNTQAGGDSQAASGIAAGAVGAGSNISQINLRGLGAKQTLILIDGRRAPRILLGGTVLTQADVNGIPLSAIERIEVLPSTAGGIYGGGAVGGVINIIRKRDYHGLELRLGLDGTFRGGGETFRAELTGGFALDHGRTSVSFALGRSASRPLLEGSNDLWVRGRDLYIRNNLGGFAYPGATPNIFGLSNLVLDNGVALNSNITHVPTGYTGVASDGGAGFKTNAGQYNTALPHDVTGTRAPLLNNPRTSYASVNVRQKLFGGVELFGDVSYQDNFGRAVYYGGTDTVDVAAGNPTNPFGQDLVVAFSVPGLESEATTRSEVLTASTGLIAKLGGGWQASPEFSWSRARTTTTQVIALDESAFADAVASGAINLFRDLDTNPIDFSRYPMRQPEQRVGPRDTLQRLYSLRVAGPLFRLPGGNMVLTALAERREEVATASFYNQPDNSFASGEFFVYTPRRSQVVNTGYAELRAPVIAPQNGVPLIRELELQFSLRRDAYRTRSATPDFAMLNAASDPLPTFAYSAAEVSSTTFTIAGRWAPVRDLAFRASYGTGFLPPSIEQIIQTRITRTTQGSFRDPLRGNARVGANGVAYLDIFGGNPDLTPERSTNLSIGAILTPRFAPGLRLSADYTRIRKNGEIGSIPFTEILANYTLYPDLVTRGPKLASDPASWAGPVTMLNRGLVNIAASSVRAYDFNADYELNAKGAGRFHFYGAATLQTELVRQALPTSLVRNFVGYFDGPLRWRGNAGVEWETGPWNLSWNMQYYDSYSVRRGDNPLSATSVSAVTSQGAERIPSQWYADLNISYRFGTEPGLLSGVRLSAGIQNLFDLRPPSVAALTGGYSRYGDPRLRRFALSLTKPLDF